MVGLHKLNVEFLAAKTAFVAVLLPNGKISFCLLYKYNDADAESSVDLRRRQNMKTKNTWHYNT